MDQKYILTEEDVRNLPEDQRRDYEDFMNTVRDTGTIYKAKLEKFDEIIQSQYKTGVLFNPNSLERYPEILSKNLSIILDQVVQYRNDVIQEKRSFSEFNFQNINEGLEELKKFVETKLNVPNYQNSLGFSELRDILPRIDQIENQISQDMKHFQGFKDEKHAAKVEYKFRKGEYDRLSTFGKLRARLSGQKQELDEAQRKNAHFNSQEVRFKNPELGEMFNPSQYDEYLEQQKQKEEEEKTGGMSL